MPAGPMTPRFASTPEKRSGCGLRFSAASNSMRCNLRRTPMTLLHQAAQKAVEAALRRAFHLGQIYWQQADSESRAQNRQAEITQLKFDTLIAETLSALQHQEVPCGNTPYDEGPFTIATDCGQEVPREPVAWLPRALELISFIEGAIYSPKCEDLREFLREIAASPSTTRQQEVGSGVAYVGPPDWLRLAQECGGTVYRHRSDPQSPGVAFGDESWARFVAALSAVVLAAAPSTPENADGVEGRTK